MKLLAASIRVSLVAAAVVCASTAPSAEAQPLAARQTAAITSLLTREQTATHIPGIALVVRRHGAIVYERSIGVDGDGAAFTARTPVWIGSLSKGFTALAIAQLAAAGRIDLDAPVARYLPDFKPATRDALRITVRQLIEQTSGLTDANSSDWSHPWPRTFADATARLSSLRSLASVPGAHHAYHNANYMLLGDVIERTSGELYADYLARHIFTPLHMTSARAVNLMSDAPEVPPGHMFVFSRPLPMRVAGMFVGGAGGVIVSAADLDRWVEAFAAAARGGRIAAIPDAEIREVLHPASTAPYLYRFGWVARQPNTDLIRHNGGLPTFVAHAAFSRDGALSIAIVTNGSLANPAWSEVGEELANGVVEVVAGRPPRSVSSDQIGPRVELGAVGFALLATALGLWLARPRRWQAIARRMLGRPRWLLWLKVVTVPGIVVALILLALPAAFGLVESWSWYWLWYLTPAVTASLWTIVVGYMLAMILRACGAFSGRAAAAAGKRQADKV